MGENRYSPSATMPSLMPGGVAGLRSAYQSITASRPVALKSRRILSSQSMVGPPRKFMAGMGTAAGLLPIMGLGSFEIKALVTHWDIPGGVPGAMSWQQPADRQTGRQAKTYGSR